MRQARFRCKVEAVEEEEDYFLLMVQDKRVFKIQLMVMEQVLQVVMGLMLGMIQQVEVEVVLVQQEQSRQTKQGVMEVMVSQILSQKHQLFIVLEEEEVLVLILEQEQQEQKVQMVLVVLEAVQQEAV